MKYTLLTLALTIHLTTSITFSSPNCDQNFGDLWQPTWAKEPRNDLRCQLGPRCKKGPNEVKSEKYDKCCTCNSCTVWEGSEIELFIEYVSVLGRSLILFDQAPNETDVYKVDHRDAEMTEIPSNLCNWDNETTLKERYLLEFESLKNLSGSIVKINFENNRIGKLTDLNCLKRLDELILKNNKLTHVSNTSFSTLSRLRYIDFSGNLIQKIDPGILTSIYLNLFHADFSHNKMSELDVSNMLSLYPFCKIDFQSNEVTKLVNEANFTLNMTTTYGPGFVSFKDNDFQEWPNFKELLNLDSLAQMGHLFSFGFDFRNVPIICDCHLENFMSLVQDGVLETVWRDYMNVKCTGPADLVGIPVGKVNPRRFICDLSANSECPTPECTCTDRPHDHTIFINCSYDQGKQVDKLNSLPKIPNSKYSAFTSLDISGHNIANITNLTRLSNISMLNVSHNNLLEINNEVVKALENATVDISDNTNLRELPKMFLQYRNVCTTYMKNLQITCDCSSLWIETWLNSKKMCINEENMFNCELPNGEIKPALSFRASDIDCSPTGFNFLSETVIAGVIVFLILTGTLIYSFRYELLILCVRMKQARRNNVMSQYRYDVFLSFNDADVNVMKWVNEILVDKLVDEGYRVFQPGQDINFGAERDSEVLKTINETSNFLLIFSDSYLDQDIDGMRPWTENEWKYGWYNFLKERHKNLIVVNFDHASPFEINHPQIKAFLRVGSTIDFKNHDRKIISDICKKLGKPFFAPIVNVRGFDNMNKKFPRHVFSTTAEEKFTNDQNTESVTTQDFPNGSDKLRKHRKHQGKPQAFKGRFAPYYENNDLKKTPHIPLFRKYEHKNEQNSTKTNSLSKKLQELSKIYELDVSNLKAPECTQIVTECKVRSPENYLPCSDEEECREGPNNLAGSSANEDLYISSNHLRCSSTELENFDNGDDEEQLFQLDMSVTGSVREVSSITNSSDSGFDTNSLGGLSNTLTTSIGSSTVSFHSDSFTCSMTDITV
ncbi:toll-like receptor 13 [Mercenaria mercenaria]|uniref:toll-like receptor 13 n=1 Tax=Mercenaria mercenaria TaxID=6596 RepID=UPI001E1DC5A6|nr:toll-like receptor 13 [Mercenaria mercenaria]